MASVGAAAAQGLESGLGIGLRLRQQQQSEEDRQRVRQQQDTLFQQQQEDRTRKLGQEEEDRQLKAITDQLEGLRAEGEGYATQYGGKVPDEIAGPYSQRVREVTGARDSILRKRYEPIIKKREQERADLSSRLQAGQLNITDVPDDDLFRALSTATRRDLRDLMSGPDGTPSKVHQAVTDVMTGLQTKNEGMLLAGANVLLEPELKVGVGEASPHGGKILGKQIVKLIPDPNDPGKFMPVVKVYVGKKAASAGDVSRADNVQAEEGAPKGATGYYLAPITKNRSSDPDDEVHSIDLGRAMDYAGQMQTLATVLDHPEVRAKVMRAMDARGGQPDDFLSAFYSVKGKMPTKTVEYKGVKPGEKLYGIDTRTGKPTGDVIEGAPQQQKPATGLAGQIQAVKDYAEENGLDEEEAAAQMQRMGLLRTPKGPAAGAGGSGAAGGLAIPKGVTGPKVLDSLSEDDARIVQGLADGSIKPSEISVKGNRREKMLALAKRFDPTADFGPNGKLKEVPAPAQKALLENNTNLQRAMRALRLVGGASDSNPLQPGEQADPEATGLKGYLPNQILNRFDQGGVEARSAIADLGSLIIHDRSGAAVTASEFPRLAPFIPTEKDDAATVRKKLNRFVQVYREEMQALQDTYGPDNGYKPFKVGGNKGTVATRAADSDRRKSGEVTQDAAPAAPAAAPAPVRTATNPKTGERLMLKDGQWVPMQ